LRAERKNKRKKEEGKRKIKPMTDDELLIKAKENRK
jgi:hypothetical protein